MEHIESVAVWADGTWCYIEELDEYLTFMSDDYCLEDVEAVLDSYEQEYYEKKETA